MTDARDHASQVMQPALAALANCVHAPPFQAHLISLSEKLLPRRKQSRNALQTPGQALHSVAKMEPELAQAASMEVAIPPESLPLCTRSLALQFAKMLDFHIAMAQKACSLLHVSVGGASLQAECRRAECAGGRGGC